MVEDSVGPLTERLRELEHTVKSHRTTPVSDDDVLNMETWSTLKQVIWTELGKVREQSQEVPNLCTLCEHLNENQKSQERQLSGLRSFARRVEQFLARMKAGATAPRESRETPTLEKRGISESLGCVPGVSASSSATPSVHLQIPTPPTLPAPPIPKEESPRSRENAPSLRSSRGNTAHFSTVRSEVRSSAIRIDITDPEQWSAGDVAVIRNQEAKKALDIGSLIFETPIQHDHEARVEVRSSLPTEQGIHFQHGKAVRNSLGS